MTWAPWMRARRPRASCRRVAREDGGWDVIANPNKYWVAPERADEHRYRERYSGILHLDILHGPAAIERGIFDCRGPPSMVMAARAWTGCS